MSARIGRRVSAACSGESTVWWVAAVMGIMSWFAGLGLRWKI